MKDTLISWRRKFISAPLLRWYRRALPPLSDTERDALEAGTVSWDAELFSGRPDWQRLHAIPAARLSTEEQAFLDGPVATLCRMLDDWRVRSELHDLPPEVWRFIEREGFLGMIIPKAYGGLGFSAQAHSAVIMKVATRSLTAAVTVMVPNSLGPAELLLEYGTPAQRNYYLPRLARGEELPCFALTAPSAGSDAAAIPDNGVVCYGDFEGRATLGLRLNWEKRYITLGPVATVMGLAFRVFDPDHLLGEQEELGITVALIPTDLPGIEIGQRHRPSHQAFQNGPNKGTDVFIPLDWVIGGRERIGQGWRMLMNCLAAGRAISLPALSTACVKFCARTTGAYARVRKQFNTPIGRFEGVEEALARMAAYSYQLEALRSVTAALVDQGEKPSVLSAIAKYQATERMRQAVNDAMDIHGGKGICDGPGNYLANIYHALPVSITVEGANILTRCLMIFGQGAIRCHPYLLDELHAARDPDPERGLREFDRLLFRHLSAALSNVVRAGWHNLSGGRWARAPAAGLDTDYYRQLSRASVSFAVVAEAALLLLGGELKRREALSGRLGDVLSELYLMSCVLKRFRDEGQRAEDVPLLQWCCQQSLYTVQQRLDEVLANFPSRLVAGILRLLVFPWGRRRRAPADALGQLCAERLLVPSTARDRLTAGIFLHPDRSEPTGQLEYALERVVAADSVLGKLVRAGYGGRVEEAQQAGVISRAEAALLEEAERATQAVIAVDAFAPTALQDSATVEVGVAADMEAIS